MTRASQTTISLLQEYFEAMEAKDVARLASYYADDITLTFANAPTITGRDAVLARMVDLLGRVRWLAHELINVTRPAVEGPAGRCAGSPHSTPSPSPSKAVFSRPPPTEAVISYTGHRKVPSGSR